MHGVNTVINQFAVLIDQLEGRKVHPQDHHTKHRKDNKTRLSRTKIKTMDRSPRANDHYNPSARVDRGEPLPLPLPLLPLLPPLPRLPARVNGLPIGP